MGELEDLQIKITELTNQLNDLKQSYDTQTAELATATADLKSAREANAAIVSKLPTIPAPSMDIEEEDIDDRTPEQRFTDSLTDFVDAIYYDRFAKKDTEKDKD